MSARTTRVGRPYWTYAGGASRTVQPGDLVQAEIMSCYGGFETQVQMSVAVEPVPKVLHTLHDVARDCYDAGLRALRPGAAFLDVARAMSEPLLKAGHYNMTPWCTVSLPRPSLGTSR